MYIYASQSNNTYDNQMKLLRKQILEDKDNFYTYSKNFLTLSIDPVNIEDQKKEDLKKEKTLLA